MKLCELLPWTEFLDVHIKKDPGLFPIYISNHYKIPFEIAYIHGNNKSTKISNLDNGIIKPLRPIIKHRIIKLFDLRRILFLFPLILYVFKNRKTNTHYLLFHTTENSFALIFFIKLFNPHAKIWLKLDANLEGLKNFLDNINKKNTFKEKLLFTRYRHLLSKIDLISTETQCTYDILKEDSFFNTLNIHIIPNGIEKNTANKEIDKQKIIISVARYGTYQKNTELLLNVLSRLELKDWQVFLIGPIETAEQNFQSKIDVFFENFPELKQKINFIGNINDKQIINNYYEKAQVFVLPSRFESFGIATLEALSYGDFVILTDVGAARDFITNDEVGYILPESEQNKQNEEIIENTLVNKLQEIIDGKMNVEKKSDFRVNYFKQYSMDNIVQTPAIKDWITK